MLSDYGWPPDEAEVFRLFYLLLLFVVPEVPLGGVEGIYGDLKGPSFVAVFVVFDFFLVFSRRPSPPPPTSHQHTSWTSS